MTESGGSFGGRAPGKDRIVGAGGTPGGLGEFFTGLCMAGIGTYLFLQHVQVHTSMWRLWGGVNGFGVSLIPLLFGLGILFFNGKSKLGWFLTIAGFGIIVVGVLMNMDIYFQRTSLFNTLLMLGLMAAGLGLVARSLHPHPQAPPPQVPRGFGP